MEFTKIFLDTSYFLNLINLKSQNVPEKFLLKLLKIDHLELFYSSITVFELQALTAKRVVQGRINNEESIKGIQSLLHSPQLKLVNFYLSSYQQLATKFRKYHVDFIDCVILSTAVLEGDVLITEDKDLKKLINDNTIEEVLDQFNIGNFEILTGKEFIDSFVPVCR